MAIKLKDRPVKKLSRQIRMWKCLNPKCGKLHGKYPDKCVCGQFPPMFEERQESVSDELARKVFVVNANFHFEGELINKGAYVSLPEEDPLTQDVVSRGLVTEVKE